MAESLKGLGKAGGERGSSTINCDAGGDVAGNALKMSITGTSTDASGRSVLAPIGETTGKDTNAPGDAAGQALPQESPRPPPTPPAARPPHLISEFLACKARGGYAESPGKSATGLDFEKAIAIPRL